MAGGIGVDAAAKGAGDAPEIGVGMLGYAFMGKAHANGYKKLSYMAWPPPLQPRLVSIAGRDEAAVAEAASRYGFDRYVTDWHELVADPDVQLLDNNGPNNLHAEPSIAAAEAGKHVFCEKPLGRTADESHDMWRRVAATGVQHMTAFNYRFVPAVRLAREMLEAGELGDVLHFRGRYLQEWGTTTADAWRFHKGEAGSGALGDLGAHVIDLARYLVGEITTVSASTATFMQGREVDDAFEAVVEFEDRALGTIEATRFAAGRKNALQLGAQRDEGLTRVRPGAPERASALRRDEGLSHDPRHGGRPPVLAVVVAPRPHHRLGAHVRPRDPPSADGDRG